MHKLMKSPKKKLQPVIKKLLHGKKFLSRRKQYLMYAFWLLPIGFIVLLYLFIFKDLPSPTKLGQYDIPLATKVYDRNNKLLFDIYAEQNRTTVALSEMPKYL